MWPVTRNACLLKDMKNSIYKCRLRLALLSGNTVCQRKHENLKKETKHQSIMGMDMCGKKEAIKVKMADSIAAGMGNLSKELARASSGVIAWTTTVRIR